MNEKPTAPRLIDANVLKERMNSDFWSNTADLVDALEIIESAPTVETTDDVMARLNDRKWEVTIRNAFQESEWIARYYPTRAEISERFQSPMNGFGKTPLEAIKKLEAYLNRK